MATAVRTILVIGRTGGGKSTVGNVIVNKPDAFVESEFGVSETKHFNKAEVTVDGVTFRVIDTIGIGDTELTEEEVLMRLASTCHECKDGIHQVLFVTRDRFTREEIQAYDIMSRVLLRPEVARFTTIVRTNFPAYAKPDKCEMDIAKVKDQSSDCARIYNAVAKIIHVDMQNEDANPDNWQQKRHDARARIMARLAMCTERFLPDELKEIEERIGEMVEDGKRLDKLMEANQQNAEMIQQLMQEKRELQSQIAESMRHRSGGCGGGGGCVIS
eukprot:m.81558 g.81558  ORF g.81558 m.81558 type:complete len:273 (-) comp14254_c0_seq6:184-1002(-)